MEEQDILKTETGTKEMVTLKPEKVKIVKVEVQEVDIKGKMNRKVSCSVKHPSKEELINLSAVKYEKANKLQVTGLWVNFDEDNKIRKGSALADFIKFLDVNTPIELEGKEVMTTNDDKGYLCFKGY